MERLMQMIKIIKTPPGFAEKHIREQWVGLVLPLAPRLETKRALAGLAPGSLSAGGYVVRGLDAVRALSDAGKEEAVAFWVSPIPPPYLVFARDCCELV